jgi:hypothetical protein
MFGGGGVFHFRWGWFIAAFALGIFAVYVIEPAYDVVKKYPTPFDSESTVYTDMGGSCYMYKAKEVPCTRAAIAQPVAA